MMKYYYLLGVFAVVGLLAASSFAAPSPVTLETQLEQLQAPINQAPSGVDAEKLYSVQTRYNPLRRHVEASVGGALNFSSMGYFNSQQIDLGARYYFSDRWFVGASGSYVFNQLSSYSKAVVDTQGFAPDASWAKLRGELVVGFNTFYGKFRLSMDKVLYFDQYISIGPAVTNYASGSGDRLKNYTELAVVGDVGFALWMGRQVSLRLGIKDYIFHENREKSASLVNHFIGHVQLGYLL